MGAIPTLPTFTAGEKLTAAKLTQLATVSSFWALTPRCSVYQTATTSFGTSGVGQVVTFDTEVFDIVQSGDSPMHDNSTDPSRIYVRTTGKYEVTGQVQFASNATGIRVAAIRLNAAGSYTGGTLLAQNSQTALGGSGSTSCTTATVEWPMNAGDYVELFGLQSSGGALSSVGGSGNTFLRLKLTGS